MCCRPDAARQSSIIGGGLAARWRHGISPVRDTSLPEAVALPSRSSVMIKVLKLLASGGALSQTLVSPSLTLVKEPALMRLSPETNYSS
jgi:hypothetical protein